MKRSGLRPVGFKHGDTADTFPSVESSGIVTSQSIGALDFGVWDGRVLEGPKGGGGMGGQGNGGGV